MGKPTNFSSEPSPESVITLNLASLKIPHNSIRSATTILMYGILNDAHAEYKSIPGATPKEITSDNESIFSPNP